MTQRDTQNYLDPMDFDQWSELARKDINTFESMRLAAIEEFIESAPERHRHRLRCLQWRIDQERRLARSPMGACIRISRMMWESLVGDDGLVDHLRDLSSTCKEDSLPSEPLRCQAEIIPIHSKR